MSRSIGNAMRDLGLDRVLVAYPGTERDAIAEGVEAVPANEITAAVAERS